jgi:hypothetical protein
MVEPAGDSETERLRREAEDLRALVRDLSASMAALVAVLPVDAALVLARGEGEGKGEPFRLAEWHETIEVTRADIAPEMDLLWKRVPPRESA